jgi:hypothetical protein
LSLDLLRYFYYSGIMEARTTRGSNPALSYDGVPRSDTDQRNLFISSVLTDRFVDELNKQYPEGRLLCSFDVWDQEEWD